MTHSVKDYNVAKALVALGTAYIKGEEAPDVRQIMADNTDIPEDRLDFATSEMSAIAGGVKALAETLAFLTNTEEEAVAVLTETVGSNSRWIDDDKGNVTVNAYREEEEGDPLFTVQTKIKRGAGEA